MMGARALAGMALSKVVGWERPLNFFLFGTQS